MARYVSPWVYRKCLRDHGLRDATLLLVLHTVASFANKSGRCFPSQATIARSAAASVGTVRSKLQKASRQHWIAIFAELKSGQGWKHHSYALCIPDSIELDENDETLLEDFAEQHCEGDIDVPNYRKALSGGPFSSKRPATGAARSLAKGPESTRTTGNPRSKERQPEPDKPAVDGKRTGTTCLQSSPPKALSESILEQGPMIAVDSNENSLNNENILRAKIARLLEIPNMDDGGIAKIIGTSADLVTSVRKSLRAS